MANSNSYDTVTMSKRDWGVIRQAVQVRILAARRGVEIHQQYGGSGASEGQLKTLMRIKKSMELQLS